MLTHHDQSWLLPLPLLGESSGGANDGVGLSSGNSFATTSTALVSDEVHQLLLLLLDYEDDQDEDAEEDELFS